MDQAAGTDTMRADDPLAKAAFDYHEYPQPGKVSITPTKSMSNQRDLALAYSPGVAVACMAIYSNPALASRYTSRANLVAVVSNGTVVLDLGNIGRGSDQGRTRSWVDAAGADDGTLTFRL